MNISKMTKGQCETIISNNFAHYAIGDTQSLYDMSLELKVDSTRVDLRRHAKGHISMIAYRVLYGNKKCNQYITDTLEEIL